MRISQSVFCAVVALVPASALAQEFQGARLLSLSESQRALATANDAIYVNPAGMALGQIYSLELNYADDFEDQLRRFNASVMDSKLSMLKAGLGYVYNSELVADLGDQGELRQTGHRLDLALAYPIMPMFGFGLTGRYINFSQSLGDTEVAEGGFEEFQMDAGLAWRSEGGFGIGAALYNFIKSEHPRVPLIWAAGVGFGGEEFSLEGDIRYNTQIGGARYSLGATYVIAKIVPVRLGGLYDLKEERGEISLGVGFQSERFGADLGYRQRVTIKDGLEDLGPERLLGLALRFRFF